MQWRLGRAAGPNLGWCQPDPSHGAGKGDSWGRGGLGATIPMGFKRPRGVAGMRDGLFWLTMRTLVLLAALVAAVAGTETFVG